MAKPDYNLCVKKEGRPAFFQVGVGWLNDKGHVHIKLDPCVLLSDRGDLKIYLFPNQDNTKKESQPQHQPFSREMVADDDVPF
jgi:hypothetical protein